VALGHQGRSSATANRKFQAQSGDAHSIAQDR
jgi:hypothetical protein